MKAKFLSSAMGWGRGGSGSVLACESLGPIPGIGWMSGSTQ